MSKGAGNTYDLVVSIINYKTAQMTIDCVRSVLEDAEGVNLKVVVVDNASADGSVDLISGWIAAEQLEGQVLLVASPTNSGFSGGHNQGIKAADADFYLVLNSDALLHRGFCKAILAAARAHPEAGLVTPRLEWDTGEPQESHFRLPSPASEIIRGANTGPVTKLLKRYDMPLGHTFEEAQVGWASFACILLRKSMIDQIGLMDDGYFLYFEDTEYCMRAKRAGWNIHHEPVARAIHFRGGSAPVKGLAQQRKRLPAYYYASRTRLFYQGYGHIGLLAANLGWHAGRILAVLRLLMGKSYPKANAHEARDIWINFLSPLGSSFGPEKK